MLLGSGKRGARVSRVLGRPDVARDVVEGLMLDRGLHRALPAAAAAEAEAARDAPVAADARVDMRDLPTFTIDPPDARDFDDAVSASARGRERAPLGPHRRRERLRAPRRARSTREAFRRGCSVYVPGAVEPMLPEVLSSERLLPAARARTGWR